ncbi:MAG TPA: mucoidy inhibitor MuiA family protein [Chryseolinea sp.]
MKTIYTFVFVIASLTIAAAQEAEQIVSSKINQVAVFLQGAQITRHASVPLKAGVSILTLTGIAPAIQQQSIQVDGPASVKILSVSFRINYMEEHKKPEKIKLLDAERKRIAALIAQEKSIQEVYTEEENILKTNKSIGGTEKGVEVAELKAAMDYFRQRLLDIKQQLMQSERTIRSYQEELAKVDAQLTELRAIKGQPSGEIVVKVSTKAALLAELDVNYLVNEARWFPSYDIRAKNVKAPVGVTYKANVSQQSGEDWENVALTISSANPSEQGVRPIIKPWIVGYNNALSRTVSGSMMAVAANNEVHGKVLDDAGEPIPGVNVVVKGTTVGTVTDVNGNYSIPLTSDAQALVFSFIGYSAIEKPLGRDSEIDVQLAPDVMQLSEVVTTGYSGESYSDDKSRAYGSSAQRMKRDLTATEVIRQTNVEFKLDEPFSIRSDGEVRATDMVEYELPAIYEYYCVPKLEEDAFLTAKILDWDQYNFLEGEASLFFEGKYIGKSILDTRNTSDTLVVSLGRDSNVLVKREKKKEYSSRQFVGSNQKVALAYEISIRNKKGLPISIVVEDQIPISNDKEITVDKLEDSHGEYDHNSGAITWKKEIASGKTEIINLKYAVRYPKGSRMLLE